MAQVFVDSGRDELVAADFARGDNVREVGAGGDHAGGAEVLAEDYEEKAEESDWGGCFEAGEEGGFEDEFEGGEAVGEEIGGAIGKDDVCYDNVRG